jgi:hypothetical protein
LRALNLYLMKEFNYRRPLARFGLSDNLILANSKKVELYLRFFSGPEMNGRPTIIIARIRFYRERVGHGRHFLHFISKIAMEHHYEFIELESCNSKCVSFAEAFGFELVNKNVKKCHIEVSKLLSHLLKNNNS